MASENNKSPNWYFDAATDVVSNHSISNWLSEKASKKFVEHSLKLGKEIYIKSINGFVEDSEIKEELIEKLKEGKKIVFIEDGDEYDSGKKEIALFGESEILTINYDDNDCHINAKLATNDAVKKDEFCKLLSGHVKKRESNNNGKAYVLEQTYDGLNTTELGVVSVPLILENYNKSVRESIENILSDLKSPFPNGKLIILEGEPGCGKTFCIRSIISEIKNAFFIIIPPSMVSQIGNPNIIPVLLRLKDNDKYSYMADEEILKNAAANKEKDDEFHPIVFIIEDADECLVQRGTDNMSAISSILNLTSGILGDLLDIRIIATTNAKKTEIDPALLRDCRLSYHMEVGRLSYEEAEAVYRRLTGDENADFIPKNPRDKEKGVTLAEVYRQAKDKKIKNHEHPETQEKSNISDKPKNKMGF